MINEILERRNEIETNKMLEAIHNQAKENYYFEKGRRYLESKKRTTKKEIKERLINDTLNFVLFVIAVIPPMLLLIVLHK